MSQTPRRPGHASRIEPVEFRRPEDRRPRRRYARALPGLLLAGLIGVFGVGAWFVFSAQAVRVEITPPPDSVRIEGGLSVPLGGRYLLQPGRYTVLAEKSGYQRLSEPIDVSPQGGNSTFRFRLSKLPGHLAVRSRPPGAAVAVDSEEVGHTPLARLTLAPGRHTVALRAERYRVHEAEVLIEGKGIEQSLEVELTPNWAPVTFRSEPPGATLLVDGEERGTTPLTTEIDAGAREVALSLTGYQRWTRELEVVADEPRELPLVRLSPAPARVRVTSEPSGATVAVGGEFRGRTPVTLAIAPDQEVTLRLNKAGHRPATRELRLERAEERALALELTPVLGTIEVRATPADATLYVDGEARGPADQTLSLPAKPHVIEIRKPGYVTHRTRVTPKPGFAQAVRVQLQSEAEARASAVPAVIETSAGQRLRLVQPGRFTMGSPRREQGRRANESQRPVELTRMFYIGTREVTNAEFRRFRASHSSGIVDRYSLDVEDQPVVRVSWEEAARYCNWLSQRDGLPPAYREGPEGMEAVTPMTTGYRLPTEAEWAWAARFAQGRELKYPWGQQMPPRGKAGNFADRSAAPLLREHLESYDDGYVVSAPVGRFAASALGLYDIGGNVSEWMHDYYDPGLAVTSERARDPLGPASGSAHMVRGSSWRHGRITELRLSYRDSASAPRDDLGFRLARYAEEAK